MGCCILVCVFFLLSLFFLGGSVVMLYVDLDNTLLDSAGRLVDYDGGYRPLCQGSYVLRADLLACFGDPEFYVPGSIGVNGQVEDFVLGWGGDVSFLSLSPSVEVGVAKRELLGFLGFGGCDFLSFTSHGEESEVLSGLLSRGVGFWLDDSPGRLGRFAKVGADFGVVRHTYNEGLFPLDRYVACANYLVDSPC